MELQEGKCSNAACTSEAGKNSNVVGKAPKTVRGWKMKLHGNSSKGQSRSGHGVDAGARR